jgi:hypothetical protein
MLHLDPERLAALADEEPTAAEVAHLAACEACAAERDAYRSLHALAASERGTALRSPISNWSALAESLGEEGLLAPDPAIGAPGAPRGSWWSAASRRWLNAAAAVLLVLGGGVAGRLSAGLGDGGRGGSLTGTTRNSSTMLASNPQTTDTALTFHSMAEAMETIQVAEQTYRMAAAYIAAQDTSADPQRFRTRLAALDRMTDAALAAVNEAPHDPVINQYYLSTVSARQATLRELDRALPSGVKLVSY